MRVDDILLVDMLLSAREAVSFLAGVQRIDFDNDRMRQLAIIKSIEVIGEAASRLSDSYREAHPEVPWRDIVGMRHRLVHGYFEVDLDRVWQTVVDDLPPLITSLDRLAPPEP